MSFNFLAEANPDMKATLDLQNMTQEHLFAVEAAKLAQFKALQQHLAPEVGALSVPELTVAAAPAPPSVPTVPASCSERSQDQASESSNPSCDPAANLASHPSSTSLKQPGAAEELAGLQQNGSSKSGSKSLLDMTEEERVKRRREINRISQRRIRERRTKEVDSLRAQVGQLQAENQMVVSRLESVSKEKSELLMQVQELTDKWRQCIAENAQINKENIELRNSLQHLNSLLGIPTSAGFASVPQQNGTSYAPTT